MSGELADIIVYLIFLLISYLLYRIAIVVKDIWYMILILTYLVGIWLYFELVNQIDHYLSYNNILNIEFGHANLELLLLIPVCYFTAIAGIIFTSSKRDKINNKKSATQ